ncbi:MAG: cytochrome b N-terminal domain-containing protein [Patescibacteria group bacterium]|nr:cytochrome b N-terminal domain-containing protein [Patescibacteria group bacterium]
MAFFDRIRRSHPWRSIFRHPPPVDRSNRVKVILGNLFLHLHPVAIPTHALRLRFTWCMGGITFLLFLVEVVTGVLLMFYYRPTTEWAYNDMLALRDVVSFGILREVHRWGAHAMVVTVMLHMLRVFLTGSYKPPREFNWVVGVLLLVFTLLLSFTGYLLPWDQLSMWAVTVGSNMVGAAPVVGHDGPASHLLHGTDGGLISAGTDLRYVLLGAKAVGEETLNRFYVLHCVALPLAAAVLMAVHFWRIRKDGGISGPL